MKKITVSLIALLCSLSAFATTWDEPWQKEIIEKSDYFVLGRVIEATDSVVTVNVLRSIGGELNGEIIIDDFFLLDLCSASGGHGPEFSMRVGEEGYFFLKKGKKGNYSIPTPTSGFDKLAEDQVTATYRHTAHQALVQSDLYEMTYTEIWKYYHQAKPDKKEIMSFIDEQLKKEPAGFEKEEVGIFFQQHVALETAYLLDIDLEFDVLKKFAESDNFHSQISALRAMSKLKGRKVRRYLLNYIEKDSQENFTKVIAVWSLWEAGNRRSRKKLWKMRASLSEEEQGFGMNIMDPRVCTDFPSPKRAVVELKR